jgi:hypothetical protein
MSKELGLKACRSAQDGWFFRLPSVSDEMVDLGLFELRR